MGISKQDMRPYHKFLCDKLLSEATADLKAARDYAEQGLYDDAIRVTRRAANSIRMARAHCKKTLTPKQG